MDFSVDFSELGSTYLFALWFPLQGVTNNNKNIFLQARNAVSYILLLGKTISFSGGGPVGGRNFGKWHDLV